MFYYVYRERFDGFCQYYTEGIQLFYAPDEAEAIALYRKANSVRGRARIIAKPVYIADYGRVYFDKHECFIDGNRVLTDRK